MSRKVLAAMSGGVDSSAAALMLLQQSYEVVGATARMFGGEDIGLPGAALNIERDIKDAQAVAAKLGIEHKVVDLCGCFRSKVIRHFIEEYQCGRTPNPCVDCNKYIKFGALLDYAKALGCDYLATGHYARIFFDEECGRWLLARGEDRRKDQSYMLFSLTQEQLAHVLLPLAEVSKDEIRRTAEAAGLVTAQKPDSQDICFVPDGDYAGLIGRVEKTQPAAGNFVHLNGQVLGRHKGMINYTIGQRKGLGIAYEYPLYVIDKDMVSGNVIVGPQEALFAKALLAENCNFIMIDKLDAPLRVTAKTRYRQEDVPATIEPCGGCVKVTFDEPMRAVTPGQAVVFYSGEYVVGGGIIKTALKE